MINVSVDGKLSSSFPSYPVMREHLDNTATDEYKDRVIEWYFAAKRAQDERATPPELPILNGSKVETWSLA